MREIRTHSPGCPMPGFKLSVEQMQVAPLTIKVAFELQMQKFNDGSYDDFVRLIDKAIDYSTKKMAEAKNIVVGMDEDQLTNLLLSPLIAMSFDASHSKNVGGNCDVVINGHNDYLWLGEAKIFSAYGKILGGYRQLTSRYSTGLPGQDRGSMIIYMTEHGDAKTRMREWASYLATSKIDVSLELDVTKPLEFGSKQPHVGSGLPVHVRHIPVVLYHAPTDTQKPPKRTRSRPRV